MKTINVRTMTISGFLIALNVVLSDFIALPGIITFGGFPIIFGGIVFGPVMGGIVGLVGDLVSFMVRPTGAFMPHFVLTSVLTGVIPGILTMILKTDLSNPKFWKILIPTLVGQVTTTVLMVPYFRKVLFGHPFIATMTRSITRQAINIPIYSLIMVILIPSLYRARVLEHA